MNEWYYACAGQQAGPISVDRLKQLLASGEVKPSDPVWRAGMSDWLPAETVPELRSAMAQPGRSSEAVQIPAPPAVAPLPVPVAQYYSQRHEQPGVSDQPHSRLGIASFVIAILALVLEIAGFSVAVVSATRSTPPPRLSPPGMKVSVTPRKSPASATIVAAGLGMIAGAFLCLIGTGLGIASLYQRRKKIFGVLGVVMNGALLLLFIGVMVLGLLVK